MRKVNCDDFFRFDKFLFSTQELIEKTGFSYREILHLVDLRVLIQPYRGIDLFYTDEEKRRYLKDWVHIMGFPLSALLYPPVNVTLRRLEVQKMSQFKIIILKFFSKIKYVWRQNFIYVKDDKVFVTRPLYEMDDSILFTLKFYFEDEIKRREAIEDARVEQFRKGVENAKN